MKRVLKGLLALTIACVAGLSAAPVAAVAPTTTPTVATVAPGGTFTIVSGSGFDPSATARFLFGDFPTPLPNPPTGVPDSSGAFTNAQVTIPASAIVGQTYQLAVCTVLGDCSVPTSALIAVTVTNPPPPPKPKPKP